MTRLAETYPFHARVLEHFKIVSDPDVGTMGVTVRDDNVLLVHNPEFVLALPGAQLGGVLLHEVHHVILGHLTIDPADYPDEWALTVAEEVTVNEFIKEPLPGRPITLKQFPTLPLLESTAARYQRLQERVRRVCVIAGAKIGNKWFDASARPCPADGAGKPTESTDPGRHGKGATRKGKAGPGKSGKPGKVDGGNHVIDNHSIWQTAQVDRQGAQDLIVGVLQQAALEVPVPAELRSALQSLGVGMQPGAAEHHLEHDRSAVLNWRKLLRRYIGQLTTLRPVFNRPSRRFPDLIGIVPGQQRRCEKPTVMAVIDTSGSITDDYLEMIDAELHRLIRTHTVVVVECDAEIHRSYKYRKIESVQGRGGTDFRPPLERQFLRKHRTDLVIYFTDGCGPAPEKSPGLPVIWCLVPGGERPAPWGRALFMAFPEGRD